MGSRITEKCPKGWAWRLGGPVCGKFRGAANRGRDSSMPD